jgi:hypothetical protein
VRGRVVNATGTAGRQTMAMLLPRERGFVGGIVGANRAMVNDAKGVFEIRGIPPGAYYLMASVYDGSRTYSARVPVDVGNSNVDDVTVTIGLGLEISGTVRVDGESKTAPPNVRILLSLREPGMGFTGGGDAKVNEQGAFTLSNVNPERYTVNVFGLADGYYVKSIRAGQDSTDIRLSGLDLTRGAAGPLEIVLSPKAAQVSGTVVSDKPVPGATVVLVPEDKSRRETPQGYKFTNTDQSGRFTLKGVEPGEYKVYAWEDIEPGAYMDPDFLKLHDGRGEAISLGEGATQDKQIKAIAAQ